MGKGCCVVGHTYHDWVRGVVTWVIRGVVRKGCGHMGNKGCGVVGHTYHDWVRGVVTYLITDEGHGA